MLSCRKAITSAVVYGLAVILICSVPTAAQELTSETAGHATYLSSRVQTRAPSQHEYRQISPQFIANGISQTSARQEETSAQTSDEKGSAAGNASRTATPNSESDLAARIRALETQVNGLSQTDGPQLNESLVSRLSLLEENLGDLPVDGAGFLESLSRNSKRVFNGRIHLDTWQIADSTPGINAIETGDFLLDPENRTLVRRARVGIRGTVPPDNMSYRLELEFSGTDGGQIRDAWLGWDDLPVLQTIRVGNQKRPYGLDQLNSSNSMTFLERPFIVESINRETRRIGVAAYGASDDQSQNWQFGAFNLVTIQDNNQIVGDTAQVEFAGRLANTVWYDEDSDGCDYAHFGLAGSLAFPGGDNTESQAFFQSKPEARTGTDWINTGVIPGSKSYQLTAVESVVNVGALQLVGEWMHVGMQREAGHGPDLSFQGGYVSLSYFLTGEHIPWNRKLGIQGRVEPHENFFCVRDCDGNSAKGMGAWQLAIRLSRADFSDSNIQGGIGENLSVAMNWYWNAHTRLQFNYILGEISDRRTMLTNGMTPIVSGEYQVIGTRFMIDF